MAKPFAITLDVGSSRANKTGSWRTERPGYVHKLPPCDHGCPAGENCQEWLYHAEGGDYEAAWRQIMADNPLPAVMGRVCYHPCETACNRGELDEAVGINSVERFLGDEGIRQGWRVEVTAPPSGKRVLVVGAGPSGLSAAYHLALAGHAVTIYDAGPLPGGMMRFGIPRYRLPREVLDAEVQRILDLGVELECDRTVDDLRARCATARSTPPSSPSARTSAGAPTSPPAGRDPDARRRVGAALDGGRGTAAASAVASSSTAAATRPWTSRGPRSASAPRRPIVVYRRTRERMPAHDFELEEALEEGVLVKWLSTIKQADEGRIVVEQMELDESGFPQPTGELEELEADTIVLALGQEADLSLLDASRDWRSTTASCRSASG